MGSPCLFYTMLIVREYSITIKPDGLRVVQGARWLCCPDCGDLLSGYDRRRRSVVEDVGSTSIYLLRRLRCSRCGRLHLEIPDIMQPQKHYAAEVIRKVEAGELGSCPADDSTIRRWKKENHPPALPVHPPARLI